MNSNAAPEEQRHPVDALAEEFSDRLRRGENPSVDDYVQRHPEFAALIRTIFPSLALVERVAERELESSAPRSIASRSTSSESSVASEVDVELTMPTSLGDFDLLRRIGSGGMGVVYEAIQRSLQRHVALKVMNSSSSDSPKQRMRFRREAEAAAGLHHTNIVPIFGFGEDRGHQYYAMQLIDGVTIHDIIVSLNCEDLEAEDTELPQTTPEIPWSTATSAPARSTGDQRRSLRLEPRRAAMRLLEERDSDFPKAPSSVRSERSADSSSLMSSQSPEVTANRRTMDTGSKTDLPRAPFRPPKVFYRNVASLVAKAANALEYAHGCGVLHRDIKPANLLLDREGTLWITDFGLARRIDVDGATQAGELLGTLRYMAPEQILGRGDRRMDIYSLGLTLFELLTLKPGLDSPQARLLDPTAHSSVRFPKNLQGVIPRDLQTIVNKACALAPEHRYARASEFEEDLRRFLEDRPVRARRIGPIEQTLRWARRNPLVASLMGLLMGLLITLAVLLGVWNRQQRQDLLSIQSEFDRAENLLREKTDALERAEREQQRAENNMQLAIQAFDEITSNISSRGGLLANDLDLLDQEVAEFEDAWLSQADVDLLQTLQRFFQRFADENAADLRAEAAIAMRRVGEIQLKIGKLEDAETSLQTAIRQLSALRRTGNTDQKIVLEEVAARREMMSLFLKRGQIPRATSMYQETRRILEGASPLRESVEGRYELAKLTTSMVASGSRFANDRRRRPPNLWSTRGKGEPAVLPAAQLNRLRRESDLNREAIATLAALSEDQPANAAFRITRARALKEQVRIERMLGDWNAADTSLQAAVEILESLLQAQPKSIPYRFELAEILSTPVGFRPSDQTLCNRALELTKEILAEQPFVPEYQALKASILCRLAFLGNPAEGRGEGAIASMQEAITIAQELSKRFPEVAIYSVTLVQYHFQLSELYLALKRPERARAAMQEAAKVAEQMQASGRSQPLIRTMLERVRERRANMEKKNEG